MRAINLYVLTRLLNNNLYSSYEKTLSLRDEKIKVRIEEIELINEIVIAFKQFNVPFEFVSDWFYFFHIPQIGKEFDLLKLGENNVVINLELKSQKVSEKKIEKQLKQNRYYLSNIADTIYSFTYVRENEEVSQLYIYDGSLKKSSFNELIDKLSEIEVPITQDIESLFKPTEYLISPLNTPQKFLADNYYLTPQQEQIKNEIILKSQENRTMWGINGPAGTGKTLLLYDLAKSLAQKEHVCIIHSGMLSQGHIYLNTMMDNVSVIGAKSISKDLIENFSVVCVDETQRLYTEGLDIILESFNNGNTNTCIFSYDFAQVLSKTEYNRNNPKKLNEIQIFQERKLTEKIRTNKEVFSFIRNMMNLNDKAKAYIKYDNIDVLYAKNVKEADTISEYYRKKGYEFITFTPSKFVSNSVDHYAENINSHQVIGQEFDNVIVILDKNFRYSTEGILQAYEHPNPDYLFSRLFYQNITRARQKLCIIVLDNIDLFTKLLSIKVEIDEDL